MAAVPVGAGRYPGIGGYGIGVTAAGRVLTLGRGRDGVLVAALTPAGAADPTYGGGAPAAVGARFASDLLVDPTGRTDVIAPDRVLRLTAAGAPDPGFGSGGEATFPPIPGGFSPQALPTPDGGLLLAAVTGFDPRPASQPALRVLRLSPAGVGGAATDIFPGFGGGYASFIRSTRLGLGLHQDGFIPGRLVQRSDGSFLLTGGVRVVRCTGEGEGFSTGPTAAASLTPALAPDRAFGGPQAPARLRLTVPAQRASSSARLRRILVRVTASGPGLAMLRVRDGRRRVLAQSLEPVYAAGSTTVRVPLTTTGRRVLGRGRAARVSVGYAFRDVLTGTANGARIARLR